MRRILLVLSVASLMAAMLVVMAAPAFAARNFTPAGMAGGEGFGGVVGQSCTDEGVCTPLRGGGGSGGLLKSDGSDAIFSGGGGFAFRGESEGEIISEHGGGGGRTVIPLNGED